MQLPCCLIGAIPQIGCNSLEPASLDLLCHSSCERSVKEVSYRTFKQLPLTEGYSCSAVNTRMLTVQIDKGEKGLSDKLRVDSERRPRSSEDMAKEADVLRSLFK